MTKRFVLAAALVVFLAGLAGCTEPEPVSVEVSVGTGTDTDNYDYVEFTFKFNQDVTLDSVHVMLPEVTAPFEVQNIAGDYEGDTEDSFRVYWLEDNQYVILKGDYTVKFWGTSAKTDEPFELSQTLTVN